jgi:hypothetical protein
MAKRDSPKSCCKDSVNCSSCKVSDMLDLFFGHELGVGETNKNLVKKFEIYKKKSPCNNSNEKL